MHETNAAVRPLSLTSSRSFPQHLYLAEDVYQLEIEWIRRNMWLLAGHESEIPAVGDYFLHEFDQDSVIVVRDRQMQIRAHHNVCRHRSSRLCAKPTGRVSSIVCPYHAWTYDLDGSLRGAAFTPAGFDKSEHSLISCHVRVHCGLIFVSLAETAPDFESQVSLWTRELQLQDVHGAKVASRALFSANANWKLAVENKLECYHCRPAHPTYCAAHPGILLGRPKEEALQARYDQVVESLPDSACETDREFEAVAPSADSQYFQYVSRQLIGEKVATESPDGKPVAPLMGRNSYNGMQTLGGNPLTSIVLNPDYAIMYTLVPRSARRTDIHLMCLVNGTAIENIDYDLQKLLEVWRRTLSEDKGLMENVQLGVESSASRPGLYLPSEALAMNFDHWYLQAMLRTTDVQSRPTGQQCTFS